jgi:sulfofructose kinase
VPVTADGFDVVGLGYAAVDLLCRVAAHPQPGTKQAMTGFERQGGGQTATALAALGRWGRRVAAVCAVGDDPEGRFAIDELERDGVDTRWMVERAGVPSLVSVILVDGRSGERTIVHHRDPRLDLQPGELDHSLLDGARCLYLDGHEPAGIEAARAARDRGAVVVLDSERILPPTRELLPLCDVVLCNEQFPREFTGEADPATALRAIARLGPATVGMTRGERGALAVRDGALVARPAFDCPVVDTTGAGDVFHAGFVHALLDDHPLEACLDFASAAAALKCGAPGGRAGIPGDPGEVWALVEERRVERS